MINRLTTISVGLVALLVACGIPDSGQVSQVHNDLGPLDDTIPTTTTTTPPTTIEPTTTTTPAITTTTIATEDATLYFISGGILVPVDRPMRKGASASEVLGALQEGPPSGDIGVGLRSAVPTQNRAELTVSEDGSGVATVDLPPNFFEPSIISQEDQRLAIGQIVLTLTEVGRIGQVRFTQAGVPIGVPRGSRELSQPGEPLPPRDYQELLESPVTTTTTTTTTPTTVATTTV
jgi:hypothetical protein